MTDAVDGGHEAPSSNDDFMGMSDEDIMNMPFPSPEDETPASEEAPADEAELGGEEEETITPELEEESDFPEEDKDDFNSEEVEDGEVLETEHSSEEEEDESEGGEESPEQDNDYKSKYEELLAPFKANGKDIKVENADDLRRLAQMGVGYNAKMAALKPVRKIAKMLENEGLLDESKISFLIDLSKNNPDAINKLVKDSGLNPLDINTESTEGYKPNTYTVDDKQLDWDEALTDLKQSPTHQKVIDVVSNKWDQASRRVLADRPEILRDLDSHMQNGIYDQVMSVVENEKLLGRIPSGVSDLDAYNHVGAQLHASGAFNKTEAPAAEQKPASKKKEVKRNSRRRAAASNRSKPAAKPAAPQNVLSMSDEEFEKTLMSKYM